MKAQELSVNDLINFLIQKRPDLVQDMINSDHNYDLNHLSPYHKEGSVYTHLMMVMNEADKHDVSSLAKIACLVHDLGKPMSRRVDDELKKVSFIGHDGASCYLMINLLFDLGLSLEEIKTLIVVVAKHQYLYPFFKDDNESSVSKEYIIRIANHFKNQKKEFNLLLELAECDNEGRISEKKRRGIKNFFSKISDYIVEEDTFNQDRLDFKVMVGAQGSGKTTYASKITGYEVISRDKCVEELFGDYTKLSNEQIFHESVDKLFNVKVLEAINKRKSILIDKTNMTNKVQRAMISQASQKLYNRSCVVFLKDFENLKEDLLDRRNRTGKFIHPLDVEKTILNFSTPTYSTFDSIEYKILKKGDY